MAATKPKSKITDPGKGVLLVSTGQKLSRRQWRKFEQVGMRPDLGLDDLVLNWTEKRVRDLEAKGAITAIGIESTIEAAPSVTVTLRDPDRQLFRRRRGRTKRRKPTKAQLPLQVDEGWDPILPPDVLGQPMQIRLDGVTYQLVKVTYNTDSTEAQLTFEHEFVYLLRRHKGAKRAPRSKVTRAQFILSLALELAPELRKRQYRFVCPELNIRQPIDKGQRKQTQTTVSGTSSGGGGGKSLDRVYPLHKAGEKGVQFSPEEVRACAAAGGFWGQELKAMEQIARGESNYYPGVLSFDGGYGLWQMTPRVWGAEGVGWMNELGGMRALTNPIVNAKLARKLYENAGKSFSPWYGTGFLTVGAGPGNGRPSRAESRALGESVTGGDAVEGSATSKTITETKSYQYSRGKGEDSWTATQRLASEVAWRAFMVGNSLYYMSEEQLYGRRPRYEVGPDHDAVLALSYDVDWGRPVSEASLTVTLARWGAPPGSVLLLDGFGPPDGRWLVTGVSRDYFAPTAEVKLVQPGKAKLEPAAEQTQRTVRTAGADTDAAAGKGPEAAQKFYARAVEISKKNYPYAWGGGHGGGGAPTNSHRGEGLGYDCSGYIGACCLAAGYGGSNPIVVSGSFGSLPGAKPGPGKFVTVHYNSGHVYASFEAALGVPHQRADTSPYGGGASGPHVRDSPRSYPGYSQCHFGGD